MCANSWVENWVTTTQNRQQNMEPLALLLPLKVLITGMVRGQKTQTSVQSDKCPHQFYSLPNGRFRRNSSEESLQSLRPRHLIIHNTFLPDKCWHVAALAHAHKCGAWARAHEMDWSADAKAARQQDREEGRGRLCHHPPTALVKAIQSILAFSSAWPSTELSVCPGESDGWTHCSF